MSGAPFFILETLGGSRIPIADPTSFGRAADNAVTLQDASVSAHHAVLRKDGAFWIVEDLGSTNGTWLNHARVEGRAVIKEGDQIQMGAQMIRVGGFRDGGGTTAIAVAPACPGCAKALPAGASFCPFCGLPLGAPVAPASGEADGMSVPVAPTAPFAIPPPKGTAPRQQRLVLGCLALAAILALLSLLAGWLIWDGLLKTRLREGGTKSQF